MRAVRVLVTGATGFLGGHIVDRLIAGGHSVRALVRTPAKASAIAEKGVELSPGDVRDSESVKRAAAGVDAIVAAAGLNPPFLPKGDPDGDVLFDTNVLGLVYAARAALEVGAKRLVSISSPMIFGHVEGTFTDESHLENLARYSGPYVISRMQQQLEAQRYALLGLHVVTLHPFFVVGAGDVGPNIAGGIVLNLLRRRLPFVLPGGAAWVGVDDVARAVVASLTRGASGGAYILTSENVSFRDLGERIQRIAGVRAPTRAISRSALRTGTALAKLGVGLTGRSSSFGKDRTLDLIFEGAYWDGALAERELGLTYSPLDESLRAAADDFRARGLWKPEA